MGTHTSYKQLQAAKIEFKVHGLVKNFTRPFEE